MKIYNTLKPPPNGWENLNLLPFVSFFYTSEQCYLNIGWLFVCVHIKIKGFD